MKLFSYPFPGWDKLAWIILLAGAAGLEFLGVADPVFATLTRLICATIPAWARAGILGVLAWHFLIQNK